MAAGGHGAPCIDEQRLCSGAEIEHCAALRGSSLVLLQSTDLCQVSRGEDCEGLACLVEDRRILRYYTIEHWWRMSAYSSRGRLEICDGNENKASEIRVYCAEIQP